MKIFKIIILSLVSTLAYGQNEEDALRYSKESLGGTARFMSMGGAMGALGGDFSAALQNPASLGKFNKNNFSFTPYVESTSTNSTFGANNSENLDLRLKLGNLSYLKSYALNPKNYNGWMQIQLGAGYNRNQSFNNQTGYSGGNNGSIIDYFISSADGLSTDQLRSNGNQYSTGLAYDAYAIDPIFMDTNITTSYSSIKEGVADHRRNVETDGGMGEVSFTLSGNYKNKLLLGGSINIVTLNYNTSFTHKEEFSTEVSFLNSFNYSGYLNVNGTGVNARIGAIFIPTKSIRIGASVETPTRISINEKFGNDAFSIIDGIEYRTDIPPTGEYDYILRTPLKANLSFAYIYKKLGSIGAEIEFVDYTQSHLKSIKNNGVFYYDFDNENEQIDNLYANTFNVKVGAEARVTSQLYLRGGYAIFGTPYNPEKEIFNPSEVYYTGGIGYNFGEFYIDFATIFKESKYKLHAYNPDMEGSTSEVSELKKQFVLTFGYRF